MTENGSGFTQYKDEAERARETKWRTGFIVVMDERGRGFVDNNRGNFGNTIERDANVEDAIYMLSMALEEFKVDRMRAEVLAAVKGELVQVGHSMVKE
jgi:hypothetical protein